MNPIESEGNAPPSVDRETSKLKRNAILNSTVASKQRKIKGIATSSGSSTAFLHQTAPESVVTVSNACNMYYVYVCINRW